MELHQVAVGDGKVLEGKSLPTRNERTKCWEHVSRHQAPDVTSKELKSFHSLTFGAWAGGRHSTLPPPVLELAPPGTPPPVSDSALPLLVRPSLGLVAGRPGAAGGPEKAPRHADSPLSDPRRPSHGRRPRPAPRRGRLRPAPQPAPTPHWARPRQQRGQEGVARR